MQRKTLTTSNGAPVDDNQNSMSAGPRGPLLLQDFHLIDKLAHFDRERIPERVVHAKGAGAHGYFELTHDVSKFTRAKFLQNIGKRTPVFTRFSTVAGERGSNDCDRDPRGFAIKFYTEEGNYDMVGNNTPVFFIKDPIKFADFLHSQKRHPGNNCKDPNMAWDFWSFSPEALHQITILFSNRGTPNGYRHMNGYSSHTFKWVNEAGEAFLVKYHFKTDSGIKNFTAAESTAKGVENKDWATYDLYNHIAQGGSSSWTWYVQVMPFADAEKYRYDVYDITKVWPHSDYPLQQVGKLVLNRNPENYHAETEQSAFAPSHLVPGIEPSLDKMLQGRLFSYPDTHRHRLGPNYEQLPINCPYRSRSANYHRDGFPMTYSHNDAQGVNYEPNSLNGPHENKAYTQHKWTVSGEAGRYAHQHPNDNYEQPRALFRKVYNDEERKTLIENIGGSLKDCRMDIKERMIQHFYKVDHEYGAGIAKIIGLPVQKSKL